MSQPLRYDGKVVLVTGAGNGLGRTYALMFGARGAKVVVNDLGGGAFGEGKSSSAADKVVEEIRALGGEAVANYDSVTDGDKIVQTALDAFGTIDVVINNAGILRDVSFAKMSEQDWNLIYQVHVHGAFKVTHAAWPTLREKNYGRVIFTASAAGLYGNFGQANYSMAKLGLHGFAQTLAEEGRSRNVHVNTIAPIAASRLTETILPPEVLAKLSPDYVSPLVGWLCHEDCRETKGLFEVGAGFVSKLRWERSEGVFFPSGRRLEIEHVAAKWDAISDFTRASQHPSNTTEAFAPLLARENTPSLGGNEYIDLDQALAVELESESSYDERDLALYALGVGAARDALDARDLKFAYELGEGFQPLPTYAVIPPSNAMLALVKDGRSIPGIHFGLETVLHGEQYTEVFRPLPPQAKLRHTLRVKAAYDKAPNAVVVFATETFDEHGDKLAYNEMSAFVRGIGGWGGERGPSGEANTPPAREPDATAEERVDPNQALLYRLSGDWNPLHADPAFAQAFGFDKPILHGLCTFGIAGRHVINAFCDGDARRFKSIKVRFADSVYPGETLVTRMWKESDTRIVLEMRVKERDKVVLRNAAVELYREIPRIAAKPAAPSVVASAASAASADAPTAADIFAVIARHLAANKGTGDQVKTLFQFNLSKPDSTWTLDLKSGDGAVREGAAGKPDTTLSLDDADFTAMSTGKADPNQLYFGGKLKIAGNVMASQKLGFLQKIDPKLIETVLAQRSATPAASATSTAPEASGAANVASADIFAAIAQHLAANKGTGEQIKTLFQFDLTDPDASWTLDLKSGDGAVRHGAADKPDVTLRLSDADFLAMCSGKADPNQLYFGGKLKIAGNVMASQKLGFLQKIDPRLALDAARARAASAPATIAKPAASAPQPGAATTIFAALAEKLKSNPNTANGLGGHVVAFKLREPEASWTVDFSGRTPKVEPGQDVRATVVFGLADADLAELARGDAQARELYQHGRLRIDGDVRLAHELDFLRC